MKSAKYRFTPCCNCGQMPTIEDTELCGPCCFGEADSLYDWLWEDWTGNKKAGQLAKSMLDELKEFPGLEYDKKINKRLHQIINESKKERKK